MLAEPNILKTLLQLNFTFVCSSKSMIQGIIYM